MLEGQISKAAKQNPNVRNMWRRAVVWALPLLLFLILRSVRGQDLGYLPDTPSNHVVLAQTFEAALIRHPHSRIVRVYFSTPSSPRRLFLQYNRWTQRPYFGSGGLAGTHGGGQVDATAASCMESEQSVRKFLRRIIENVEGPASSFNEAFRRFTPGTLCPP